MSLFNTELSRTSLLGEATAPAPAAVAPPPEPKAPPRRKKRLGLPAPKPKTPSYSQYSAADRRTKPKFADVANHRPGRVKPTETKTQQAAPKQLPAVITRPAPEAPTGAKPPTPDEKALTPTPQGDTGVAADPKSEPDAEGKATTGPTKPKTPAVPGTAPSTAEIDQEEKALSGGDKKAPRTDNPKLPKESELKGADAEKKAGDSLDVKVKAKEKAAPGQKPGRADRDNADSWHTHTTSHGNDVVIKHGSPPKGELTRMHDDPNHPNYHSYKDPSTGAIYAPPGHQQHQLAGGGGQQSSLLHQLLNLQGGGQQSGQQGGQQNSLLHQLLGLQQGGQQGAQGGGGQRQKPRSVRSMMNPGATADGQQPSTPAGISQPATPAGHQFDQETGEPLTKFDPKTGAPTTRHPDHPENKKQGASATSDAPKKPSLLSKIGGSLKSSYQRAKKALSGKKDGAPPDAKPPKETPIEPKTQSSAPESKRNLDQDVRRAEAAKAKAEAEAAEAAKKETPTEPKSDASAKPKAWSKDPSLKAGDRLFDPAKPKADKPADAPADKATDKSVMPPRSKTLADAGSSAKALSAPKTVQSGAAMRKHAEHLGINPDDLHKLTPEELNKKFRETVHARRTKTDPGSDIAQTQQARDLLRAHIQQIGRTVAGTKAKKGEVKSSPGTTSERPEGDAEKPVETKTAAQTKIPPLPSREVLGKGAAAGPGDMDATRARMVKGGAISRKQAKDSEKESREQGHDPKQAANLLTMKASGRSDRKRAPREYDATVTKGGETIYQGSGVGGKTPDPTQTTPEGEAAYKRSKSATDRDQGRRRNIAKREELGITKKPKTLADKVSPTLAKGTEPEAKEPEVEKPTAPKTEAKPEAKEPALHKTPDDLHKDVMSRDPIETGSKPSSGSTKTEPYAPGEREDLAAKIKDRESEEGKPKAKKEPSSRTQETIAKAENGPTEPKTRAPSRGDAARERRDATHPDHYGLSGGTLAKNWKKAEGDKEAYHAHNEASLERSSRGREHKKKRGSREKGKATRAANKKAQEAEAGRLAGGTEQIGSRTADAMDKPVEEKPKQRLRAWQSLPLHLMIQEWV